MKKFIIKITFNPTLKFIYLECDFLLPSWQKLVLTDSNSGKLRLNMSVLTHYPVIVIRNLKITQYKNICNWIPAVAMWQTAWWGLSSANKCILTPPCWHLPIVQPVVDLQHNTHCCSSEIFSFWTNICATLTATCLNFQNSQTAVSKLRENSINIKSLEAECYQKLNNLWRVSRVPEWNIGHVTTTTCGYQNIEFINS